MSSQQFVWHCAAKTDTGKVRSINEDAILSRPDIGVWAVADGMGGHESGDLASQLIVDRLSGMRPPASLDAFVEAMRTQLKEVNTTLCQMAQERKRNSTIGSTIALLLALDGRCAVLWAGDSRVYRLRNNRFEPVTKDHSQVQELVDQGVIKAEDAESHPLANVITRAVGAMEHLEVDVNFADIQAGDHYLICSDGLYKEVIEQEIRLAMTQCEHCEVMVDELIELAKSRNARDNLSVISVIFTDGIEHTDEDQTLPFFSLENWKNKLKGTSKKL